MEPQAHLETVPDRKLKNAEILKNQRKSKKRLTVAFTQDQDLIAFLSQGILEGTMVLERYFPEANGQWHHTFTKDTQGILTLLSEFVAESGDPPGSDTLKFIPTGARPEVKFTKLYRGQVVEDLSNTQNTLSAGDLFISRLEKQAPGMQKEPS